jgi:hypothetical protein
MKNYRSTFSAILLALFMLSVSATPASAKSKHQRKHVKHAAAHHVKQHKAPKHA